MLIVSSLFTSQVVRAADNWPAWRGPFGNSMSAEFGLPLVWSEQRNVKFRTEIPGTGASSPIVWGDAVFVTSQEGESLRLLKINRQDGSVAWSQEVGQSSTPRESLPGRQSFHQLHNLASPTPVTDGEIVIAMFGNGLMAAYNFDGAQLWKRDLQADFGRFSFRYGYASSPLLIDDLVVINCLHQDLTSASRDAAPAYLDAHDKKTGHLVWRVSRTVKAEGEAAEAYGTPAVRKSDAGEQELIVMGGNIVDAYDSVDGKRLWSHSRARGTRVILSPTVVGGSLVGMLGKDGMFLLKMPGTKPINEETLSNQSITWRNLTALPETCSPVAWGDMLFTITDNGQVSCYDGATGRSHWRRRLPGKYRASPVAADGRVYFLNDQGLCTVVGASARYHRLSENQLGDRTLASMAISQQEIFIRGGQALYCVTRR
ncbi:MAG: PQQ-binding-like beta-propeller repeat protein [Pirellulales bacterium]|nr:PQQ-binding-like beta-propeller repeat protein [Pirellulales bacterium]